MRTIVDNPVIGRLAQWWSRVFLWFTGWKLEQPPPNLPKFVLILVPHTSNWDFAYGIAMVFSLRLRLHWMGKASLFKGIAGPIMRWFGGIPIDRGAAHNVAKQAIQRFADNDEFLLALAPEGTRSAVKEWKKGFYTIAKGAGVPVVCGFLDFKRKLGGFGPVVYPSENPEADFQIMYDFYSGVTGRIPSNYITPGARASADRP